jgi:hypothetical protein
MGKITGTNWFTASWQCVECPHVIDARVRLAVVESQTGARCECPHCGAAYRVRRSGATLIPPDEDVAFVDADGKPFKYRRPTRPHNLPVLSKETDTVVTKEDDFVPKSEIWENYHRKDEQNG